MARVQRLLAISDLHVGFRENRDAVAAAPSHPDDWLVIAGDVGETEAQLVWTLDTLKDRFYKLIWVPGNHELWSPPRVRAPVGVARYQRLVELCRSRGVLTPEDPYAEFPDPEDPTRHYRLAPLFLLYDYSFRPANVSLEEAVPWALEHELLCADELLLRPDPFPTRQAWCHHRCGITETRLSRMRAEDASPVILINHFPLREEVAKTPAIPRFSIWCGTRRSAHYHTRFGAAAVISGHLHIRAERDIDGVTFHEVSLGYPGRQWHPGHGIGPYLRQILPPIATSVPRMPPSS